MNELLIALAMALVFWLGYVRGHNAGVMECKRQYFARTYLTPANFDYAGIEFVRRDRDGY